ncbi:hypothetical protein DL89DRAFT_102571 [Linderina pennispora]|uniref:Uncharacterized protein n=1 Tax=Linderina pennispora TaxID=61395 RepID=A0A1Y1WEA6_9FUNG|nr:uncharacterized protein DL89DRAFT_102571 [Linderina pennispora]ORX71860.1 hypothetical protein DL89DRAFT_102571 [Linderina pennispora]
MDPNQGYGYNSYSGYRGHAHAEQGYDSAQASSFNAGDLSTQDGGWGCTGQDSDRDLERRLHLSDANSAMLGLGTSMVAMGAMVLKGAFSEKPKYRPPQHIQHPDYSQTYHGRYEDYQHGHNPNAHLISSPNTSYETCGSTAATYSGSVQMPRPQPVKPQKQRPSKPSPKLMSASAPVMESKYGLYNSSSVQRPPKPRPNLYQSVPAMGAHQAGSADAVYQGFSASGPNQPVTGSVLAPSAHQGIAAAATATSAPGPHSPYYQSPPHNQHHAAPHGQSWSTEAHATGLPQATLSMQPHVPTPQPSDTISISPSALAHDAAEAGFFSTASMYRPGQRPRRQSASPRMQSDHNAGNERLGNTSHAMVAPSLLSTVYMETTIATQKNEAKRWQQMEQLAQSSPAITQQPLHAQQQNSYQQNSYQQNSYQQTGPMRRAKKQVQFASGV